MNLVVKWSMMMLLACGAVLFVGILFCDPPAGGHIMYCTQSVYLSVCLSVSLFILLSCVLRPSVDMCPSVFLSFCPSISPSICPSIPLSVRTPYHS